MKRVMEFRERDFKELTINDDMTLTQDGEGYYATCVCKGQEYDLYLQINDNKTFHEQAVEQVKAYNQLEKFYQMKKERRKETAQIKREQKREREKEKRKSRKVERKKEKFFVNH